VGILEDKQQMKRRITMIAQFNTITQWPAVAFALLLALGLVTLTDAQSSKTTTKQAAKAPDEGNAGPAIKTLYIGQDDSAHMYAPGILSPDESKVVFVDYGPASADLFVKDLQTGSIQKLTAGETNTPGVYEQPWGPVWSHDSRQIAYTWSVSGKPELKTVFLNRGETKVVQKHNPELTYDAEDWSPDGKFILCRILRKDKSVALGTVSVESGDVRQLVSFPWNQRANINARYSPDGKFIAYAREQNGNKDVFVLTVEGMAVRRLTDSSAEDGSPNWSADGKYVLFRSNRRENWDLWAVEVKDGRAVGSPFVVKYDFS
jgi:Tol biopolymer transport system component